MCPLQYPTNYHTLIRWSLFKSYRFGSTPPKSRATQAPSLVGRTSYRMRLTSLKPGSGWRSAVGSIDAQRGRQGMYVGEEKHSLKSVDRFFGTQIHATLLTRPKYYVRF